MRVTLWILCAVGAALGGPATEAAPDPAPAPPLPPGPLQTKPSQGDDAWILDGWMAAIAGIGGDGKTQLVVNGEEGYRSIIELDGQVLEKGQPAVFELEAKDHRIPLTVIDARGATWSEVVDVPKSMRITVEIKAVYLHRGYEGTVKNDTLTCKRAGQRKKLKFEIYQAGQAGQAGAQVGNFIVLDPGKSAPGVRLKIGSYELRVYTPAGKDWKLRGTSNLEVKDAQWRFDAGCE